MTNRIVKPIESNKNVNQTPISPRNEDIKITPKKNLNPTFGNASRMKLIGMFTGPAPNAYQRIITSRKLSERRNQIVQCTFGIKPESYKNADFEPGPGKYFPDILKREYSMFKIGGIGHQGMEHNIYNDKFYDIPDIYTGPAYKFGREAKEVTLNRNNQPGPGSYNTINYIGNLPKYALEAINNN